MNLIKIAIERPIAVVAAVLMVVLFGLVALQAIPIQLAPDVNRPVITVTTSWPGGAPAEVEREIINRQEEQMSGLEGLQSITGRAEQGRARITLEFDVGTNMDRSLLLVSNRLDRVTGYPDEAKQPTLDTAGSEDSPIAWLIIQRINDNKLPINEFGNFVEDVLKDRLERVPGVSRVNVFGTSEREIHITVDPHRLARYQLTISDIGRALREANASVSAGGVDEGKRRYVVRTEGELNTLEKARVVLLRSVEDKGSGRLGRVKLGDVATVGFGYTEPTAAIRLNSQPALAMNVQRETGANVIETMRGIRDAVDELNQGILPNMNLRLEQVYDETVYINSAIQLVKQNIWIGGILAAIILLLFLRSLRATLIISIAIPVSVIGAFVAMAALGRSINVISLAGLAFAVGMVVDAAIVVLENIFRMREQGRPIREAAYEGTKQVWGAILVSALTTVMVFIPILVMDLEVGQLFRDIAVAISVSVMLSLIVSITVIPALSQKLFQLGTGNKNNQPIKRLPLPGVDSFANSFVTAVTRFINAVVQSRLLAFGVVAAITLIAIIASYFFLPKLEYLPEGNRNLVLAITTPPPGYNLATTEDIARDIEKEVRHLWSSETGPESEPGQPPKMARFFFVARRGGSFIGAAAVEPQRAGELIPVLRKQVFKEPGTFGFIVQPSIFGRGLGGGKKIELDISGPDLETILSVSLDTFRRIQNVFPRSEGNQLRPNPGLELGVPEVRVVPDQLRLTDNGLSARELALTVDAFNDGIRITEVTAGGKLTDVILKGLGKSVKETQDIGALPVVTSSGMILPVRSVADIVMTAGPTEIRHRERFRTITLEIRPGPTVELETALVKLSKEVIEPMTKAGLPSGVRMNLSGTARKLDQTWQAMKYQLLLAIIIVGLVMAVLFESFVYPLIILLSVPLAAAGGVAGLAILNIFTFQPLDMLTLLGFVILIGIVVNNAILLVHQTLYCVREQGMEVGEAITNATRNRIRPIFMSTLTSVFGMLPLVLFPGAGSELYRGLGSVVVGGLSLSAALTLLIIPPMLTIVVAPLERRRLSAKAAQGEIHPTEVIGK